MNNNINMIDAWLNEAACGYYRIEDSWTPVHTTALVERMHDAITSPDATILMSLELLLGLALQNATGSISLEMDGNNTQRASALGQLEMARQLVEALNLQTEAQDFRRAIAEPTNNTILEAIYNAQSDEGLTMAQLRALNVSDAFTLRRSLEKLCDIGVLEMRGTDCLDVSSLSNSYLLSAGAEFQWLRNARIGA